MFSATRGSPPSYSSLKISLCSSSSEILAFSAGDSSVKGRGAGGGTCGEQKRRFLTLEKGVMNTEDFFGVVKLSISKQTAVRWLRATEKPAETFFDPPKGVRLFTKPHGSHTPSPVPVTREFRISRQIGQSANQIALV